LADIDIVYIASNHASHAEYAISCLKSGKHVYIEKPHVVNEDQLIRLVSAIRENNQKVFLGFNRPGSKLGQEIQRYLSSEEGPGIYNWFIAGHQIEPDHWYFRPEEGGRVLGNLCHWTDFLLQLVHPDRAYPIEVVPVSHEKSDSDIAVTYKFNEGTIGIITFSAKGHTFEGVREKFNGHKGNCLISMSDFQKMTVEVLDKKKIYTHFYRDQGHKINIVKAYQSIQRDDDYDYTKNISYIWNTAWLYLKTRQALETSKKVIIRSYSEEAITRKKI
jgi:predicted dehydrogenase